MCAEASSTFISSTVPTTRITVNCVLFLVNTGASGMYVYVFLMFLCSVYLLSFEVCLCIPT